MNALLIPPHPDADGPERGVAHHLATIQQADIIFVVKEHAIAERGTHAELLASGGFYSELYDLQFRQVQPDLVVA